MRRATSVLALILAMSTCAAGRTPAASMVRIPAGTYLPLFAGGGHRTVVPAFRLDIFPVTRSEYAAFISTHPEWKRSAVRTRGYLAEWPGDMTYGVRTDAQRAVTSVPRAAAAAYCSAQGKRLPTLDEWEYAAGASRTRRDGSRDPSFNKLILSLYTRARPALPAYAGSGFMNAFGVNDMLGVVWEWVNEDNHAGKNMRMPDGSPHDLSCVGSANGASDPTNFAAFMRYAYRSGLHAASTGPNLGFRCAAAI